MSGALGAAGAAGSVLGGVASVYTAFAGAAQAKRNARMQEEANIRNYLLNLRQLNEQQLAAETARGDQLAQWRLATDNDARQNLLGMNMRYDDRADALDQRQEQRLLAADQRRMATAGSVNARGDRVSYVDGVGWVETPSERTASLLNASDVEERERLTTDAARSRGRREDTRRRQILEGSEADALLAQLRPGQDTAQGTEARMLLANSARASAGADELRSALAGELQRRGTNTNVNSGDIDRAGRAALVSAVASARADAPAAAVEQRSQRDNGLLNRYNNLAGRATSADDVPFTPTSLDEGLSGSRRGREGVMPQAIGAANSLVANGSRALSSSPLAMLRAQQMGGNNPTVYGRTMMTAPTIPQTVDRTGLAIGGLNTMLDGMTPKLQMLYDYFTGDGERRRTAAPTGYNSDPDNPYGRPIAATDW